MATGTATKLASVGHPQSAAFADLVVGARVELYACLQLLAERARFITGAEWVAVTLREREHFVYRIASGAEAPEIGEVANINPSDSPESSAVNSTERKPLVASIRRDADIEGFFHLSPKSGSEFSGSDRQAVLRLADLAAIALDHMYAAEHSERLIVSEQKPLHTGRELALVWHAPEGAGQINHEPTTRPAEATPVHTCASCGFPVSPGRKICVDCEERGASGARRALFETREQESWISAHGYTVGSILLTAAAAAIIYWLR